MTHSQRLIRTFIPLCLLAALLVAVLPASAHAQEARTTAEGSAQAQAQAMAEVPEPRVLPGSGLYQMKLAWESFVDLFFVGEAQVRRDLEKARMRQREAALVTAQGDAELGIRTQERARARLDSASRGLERLEGRLEAEELTELFLEVRTAIEGHLEVLANLRAEASAESRAAVDAITTAYARVLTRLNAVRDRVMENLEGVEANLRLRLESTPLFDVEAETGAEAGAQGGAETGAEARGGAGGAKAEGGGSVDLELR